jgi:hypothetical protein
MRRLNTTAWIAAAWTLAALVLPPCARAQHWNDAGPGRDLLSSTITDFESFRQRVPSTGATTPGAPAAVAPQARAPIPILDWVPPPTTAQQQQARRASGSTRRSTTPRSTAARDESAPAAAPAARPAGGDWERTFAERERELDRLRRILEDDRARFERSRQPQLQ